MQEDLEKRNEENVVDNTDYIDAIKELKQNSVDKAKYDALRLENKKLLEAVVNGQQIEQVAPAEVDIDQLRKDLVNSENMSNLEYVTKALELRNALLDKGYEDPFVPQGEKITATEADYATAHKVATALQEMVDVADGDNNVFLNEFHRRVKDTNIRRK